MFHVIVVETDSKNERTVAAVPSPDMALSLMEKFASKAFLQEVKGFCKEPGITSETRKNRTHWYFTLAKAQRLGIGRGIYVVER